MSDEKMKLGVLVALGEDPEPELARVAAFGVPTCQVQNWNVDLWRPDMAAKLAGAAKRQNVQVSALWIGLPGPAVWDFIGGPATIGFVPKEFRRERVTAFKQGADFAAAAGIPFVITHAGFIPENPNDKVYAGLIPALKDVAEHCAERSLTFCFETGQETPVTLLRTIEDVGLDDLGINFDTANLILYGKANPVDALDVIGRYVRCTHMKDGTYPTTGKNLGEEKPLGKGKANIPAIVAKLKALDYRGALTIEREITGAEQDRDIRMAKEFLEGLIRDQ